MRKAYVFVFVASAALVLALLGAARPSSREARSYVVVYEAGTSTAAARSAVEAAGGTIVKENLKVGVATAVSSNPNFLDAARQKGALFGATRNLPIGHAEGTTPFADGLDLALAEGAAAGTARTGKAKSNKGAEPLADLQWGMKMIHATAQGSYAVERGDKNVLVGVMDTGIDASHPDIAPNFSRKLSRNFTTDQPDIVPDGPCEEEPDHSCSDPADVDEAGHGTHVASIIASPINGLGVAGVAPDVTLVNIRAGQDSGYFFLQSTVDAFTYAGDRRLDVVNMSFYTDPWRYNCTENPADSPTESMEQRTVIEATNRALEYAHRRGVIFVGSAGNEHEDLGGAGRSDTTSPDFGAPAHPRPIDNDKCFILPTEGTHVMSITALGPTTRKADYSNYGVEEATVAAPGGWFRDDPWHVGLLPTSSPQSQAVGAPNEILAAYPESLARENGDLNPDGSPNNPFVVRDCRGSTCAYYQYLQGTSMASPHAAGVVALIVSRFGHGNSRKLTPEKVQQILERTATDHPCPEPRLHSYADKGRGPEYNALCVGTEQFNGFYGHGIADALRAVQGGGDDDD
jgi:lantibiotic leader peptide-processing serine protease